MEKLAPQVPLPSTSSATTLNQSLLFNPHLMQTSPPNAIQIMANSIFSQNPFFNPAFPLAALGSSNAAAELNHVQQWFQQQASPYSSPLASNTPSLANLSTLSLFTNDSTLTLNSQFGSKSKLVKKEEFESPKADEWLRIFITFFKDSDDMVLQSLRSLKMFVEAIVNKKISMSFDPKELQQLIRLMLGKLALSKEQKLIYQLLDVLATLSSSEHYKTVVREMPNEVLRILVDLITRAGSFAWHHQHIVHMLRILYNSLSSLNDKAIARTEAVFSTLANFLKNPRINVQFFSLGILQVLVHGQEHWKEYVVTSLMGIDLILNALDVHDSPKFIRRAILTLNTLIDSKNTTFAAKFVQLNGIEIIVKKMNSPETSLDDFSGALFLLRLVSDIPAIANIQMDRAIYFALRCTIPLSLSRKEFSIYLKNVTNALGSLRNILALNEQGRNYLLALDQGQSIPHLVGLASQSFHYLATNKSEMVGPNAKIDSKKEKFLMAILEESLAILSLINKETAEGKVTQEQQIGSKKMVEDESAMLLYQLVLDCDNTTLQKSVLMSLRRIVNTGVIPPMESRGRRMSETLLKFIFNPNLSANRLPLVKLAAEVLTRLVSDPSRLHLAVVVPLLNTDNYRPFELLNSITNNPDLYLAILKLIKQMCQRESSLKALWFNSESNVNLLKCLKTTSNNQEIVNLCSKMLELLQMQMAGEDSSESSFYDIFTQSMELDQSGMS